MHTTTYMHRNTGHDPPDNIIIIIFYLINILSLKEKHYRKGKKVMTSTHIGRHTQGSSSSVTEDSNWNTH